MTLSLYRFDSVASRLWAFAMMGLARGSLARMPGLGFWKLCGAGSGVGFTPKLDMRACAILCAWDDPAALDTHPLFSRYRKRATTHGTLFLTPLSVRGAWSGCTPFRPAADPGTGPFAVLTRATLRRRTLRDFWSRVPDVGEAIAADRNVRFKIGLGEVPFLQQITFSIWPDLAAMRAFAHAPGAHRTATAAVREGDWFREELYARFRVTGARGTWDGIDTQELAA